MRKQACVVCIAVLVVLVPSLLAAGEAAASSGSGKLVPVVANARALPAISVMARESSQAQGPAEPEWFDDSPLDTDLLVLAAWLPIAGAVIAVAMEGGSPKMRRAREPGSEPSLD